MKYTIKEVMPAQILVEFEDETIAFVPISPEATSEQIDHAVAQYDPDYLPNPQDLINQSISVGEERESKKVGSATINSPITNNTTQVINSSKSSDLEYVNLMNSFNPINLVLANYYANQGDTRIKDALNSKVSEYLNMFSLSAETILNNINLSSEDIVAQAESELNAEATQTLENTTGQTTDEINAEQS